MKKGAKRILNVSIWSEGRPLHGVLLAPPRARGVVLLLDLGDSSDLARTLAGAGLASLAIDLAAPGQAGEEASGMDRLCSRLFDVTQWLRARPEIGTLPIACVARGPSAAAAVIEAARQPDLLTGLALRDPVLHDAGPWLARLRVRLLRAHSPVGSDELLDWLLHPPGAGADESAAPARAREAGASRRGCKRGGRAVLRELRALRRGTYAH